MNKPELLAPAGSIEHFYAAVENGADAVYCGGKLFNARQYAENFTQEQLKEAIKYAHSKNVKVYMTLNTLVKQSELNDAIEQAEEGIKSGIDCFIVQDMGMIKLLKEKYPDVPLHLSTQATTYDLNGVKFAEKMGFKRVVLAREMSLETMKKCCSSDLKIETEVFVHGALCMCLSGQCSMSSLIGERSGNRGSCAQPCRKKYSLETLDGYRIGEPGFLLSPKDISYIDMLDQIIKTGVDSLKIEGRLKSPEYAALAVRTFRKYIDKVCSEDDMVPVDRKDMENLEQVFSRGGFSKGYLQGKQNGALLSGDSPKHKGLFLGTVKNVKKSSVNRDKSVIEIDLKKNLSVGDGVEIMGRGFPGGIVTYIASRNGVTRSADAGQKAWIGDIPGIIKKGELVYKVSDKKLNAEIRHTFDNPTEGKERIKGFFTAVEGRTVSYSVTDSNGRTVKVEGTMAIEAAKNAPVSKEKVLKQLSKTGNTPYELAECKIEMEDNLLIPVSEINKVRREALEKLQNEK